MYRSQQETLKIYKQSIEAINKAQKFVQGEGLCKLVKEKRGKGRPRKYPIRISYRHGNDLCAKLSELVTAKSAGNNASDDTINAILDELLNKHFIKKDNYNILFKNIFSSQ